MSRISITSTALVGFVPSCLLLLGLGSSAWASSKCDYLNGTTTDLDKVTICQPNEYQGSYGVREWQGSLNTICSWIEQNRCVTLDDMNCDGSPQKCLKWGNHAYAGQVVLPVGIKMWGWGSWSCEGNHRKAFEGTSPAKAENFWDYHWRIDAFKFFNSENFQCEKNQTTGNYELINKCAANSPKSGRWVHQWAQQGLDPKEYTIKRGVENATSTTNTKSWQNTVSVGFEQGFSLSAPVKGVEVGISGGVNVGFSHTEGGSNAVTNVISKTTEETVTRTFNQSGSYWQFIATVGSSNGCPAHKKIYTEEFVVTPNLSQPPCCPPGTFKDINNANGDCIDPTLKICGVPMVVTIYQHGSYSGVSKSLAVGNYDINQLGIPNDSLSSLKVPSGMKVTLYEHGGFRGNTLVLTKDTPFVGGSFNDKTSSIKVEQVTKGDDSETLEGLLTDDEKDNATCDSEIASMDESFSVDIPCVIVEESLSQEKMQLTLINEEPLTWIIGSQEEIACEPSTYCATLTKNRFLILHDILVSYEVYDAILKENDSGQWEYQTHYPMP